MSETVLRQWAMLRAIPRAPRKIEASRIKSQLEALGFETTLRTVQRDLVELARSFPLTCNETDRPYGWQWVKDAHVFDVPGMDPQTALTFLLVEGFLKPLLPPSTLSTLEAYINTAKGVLDQTSRNQLAMWPDKVRIVPRGQPLKPPTIDHSVITVVYEALLENRRFEARYCGRTTDKEKLYIFNPLGLVYRDGLIYLIASLWDYPDIKQFLLHRMKDAMLTDYPSNPVADFRLDDYVGDHAFEYVGTRDSETIKLVARFDAVTAVHLRETPLSNDQVIAEPGDDLVTITATVANTDQLRWWLLGFGTKVEILAPESLRKEFLSLVSELARLYTEGFR
jgi:predicted DNA-binding transcriptional regulator YafY